jgi:hypothetical protein
MHHQQYQRPMIRETLQSSYYYRFLFFLFKNINYINTILSKNLRPRNYKGLIMPYLRQA